MDERSLQRNGFCLLTQAVTRETVQRMLEIFRDTFDVDSDVLAMRPLVSHSSGSSTPGTKRHRRILHLEFSALPGLPDGMQWHDFVSPAARLAR